MRKTPTEAERRLWWHIRHRLIEVDGTQHGLDRRIAYGAARTAVLEQHGFRVLRFTNPEVMTGIDGVLDTVLAALPSPPVKHVMVETDA